jgi:hypothetical protein
MKRCTIRSSRPGGAEDLGCSPNVITRICFRLLDILCNLTNELWPRPSTPIPEAATQSVNPKGQFRSLLGLIHGLIEPKEKAVVNIGGPADLQGLTTKPQPERRNELTNVQSLREDWLNCHTRMEEWQRILRIPDKLIASHLEHFRFDSSAPLNGIIQYLFPCLTQNV